MSSLPPPTHPVVDSSGFITVPWYDFLRQIPSPYQDGTWSPVILAATNPTVAYLTQIGNYQRVGNWCHYSGLIQLTSISGGGGSVSIGLPFTVSTSETYEPGPCLLQFITSPSSQTYFTNHPQAGTTYTTLFGGKDGATVANIAVSGLSTHSSIYFSGSFKI